MESSEQPKTCRLIKQATEEELVDLYKQITGKAPEPGKIQAIKDKCVIQESIIKIDSELVNELVKENLKKSITEEKKAYTDYTEREKQAEEAGDIKTSELYRHIKTEEKTHEVEFSSRLKEIECLEV
jgi:hypothetical protein